MPSDQPGKAVTIRATSEWSFGWGTSSSEIDVKTLPDSKVPILKGIDCVVWPRIRLAKERASKLVAAETPKRATPSRFSDAVS